MPFSQLDSTPPLNDRINRSTRSISGSTVIINASRSTAGFHTRYNNTTATATVLSNRAYDFTKYCLQLGRQVAWWIVFVPNDIIAFVDRLKQSKSIANTEDGCEATSEQLAYRGTWVLSNLTCQLTDQLLLTLFNIRLHNNTTQQLWHSGKNILP